jgi:hypothetical protein
MDESFNTLAEDGNTYALKLAMINYLNSLGYEVNTDVSE